MTLINYFKAFFYPTVITYSYNQPKEVVIAKVAEVLNKNITPHSSNDLTGKFLNDDSFAVNTVSLAKGITFSSPLVGQIIGIANKSTEIKTTSKPGLVLYVCFFGSILLGLIHFYKYSQSNSTGFLFLSLTLIIGGPAFLIGFSKVATDSIRERFEMYIDKPLKN